MNTEDYALHDQCPRLRTWSSQYMLPRIPLIQAMYSSLRAGLLTGEPRHTKDAFLSMAAMPGIDLGGWNIYEQCVHHATMIEVICAYLLGKDGPWVPADAVDGFLPQSYQLTDGRLRRVVLCSSWDQLRQQEELNSWRTVADTTMTNRPMLLNAVVIGHSRKGFRPSPWTQGYIHPTTKQMRIKRREGNFTDNWTRVYRESTDKKTDEWLKMMQEDEAFEGVVFSALADVSPRRDEYRLRMNHMAMELQDDHTDMRRAACFKLAPCIMAKICHHSKAITPTEAGWELKRDVIL